MNTPKDLHNENSSDSTSDKSESSTRQKLLNAAKRLFAEKGFAATSVKDLAEHAEVNVSLISYHFGVKTGCMQSASRNSVVVG